MSKVRLVLEDLPIQSGDLISLAQEQVHYLRSVLRVRVGDDLEVLDGKGTVFPAKLETLTAKEGELRITGEGIPHKSSPIKTHLIIGLPKGDKLDRIVRTATSLGVHCITPVCTARSVPKPVQSRSSSRLERLQKLAREATRLSGRPALPVINQLEPDLGAALLRLGSCADQLRLVPYEGLEQGATTLGQAMEHSGGAHASPGEQGAGDQPGQPPISQVVVLIGPEGGLESSEVELCRDSGFIPVSLGPRILPVEVAASATMTIVLHRLGELG